MIFDPEALAKEAAEITDDVVVVLEMTKAGEGQGQVIGRDKITGVIYVHRSKETNTERWFHVIGHKSHDYAVGLPTAVRRYAESQGITSGKAVIFRRYRRNTAPLVVDLSRKPRRRRTAPVAETATETAAVAETATETAAVAETATETADAGKSGDQGDGVSRLNTVTLTDWEYRDGAAVAVTVTDADGVSRRLETRQILLRGDERHPFVELDGYTFYVTSLGFHQACRRCGGTGWFDIYVHVAQGVCLKCRGSGLSMPLKARTFAALEKTAKRKAAYERAKERKRQRDAAAKDAAREEFRRKYPGVMEAAEKELDRKVPRDGKAHDLALEIYWLRATKRQIDAFLSIVSRLDGIEAKRQAEKDAAVPVPEGCREVFGVVIRKKFIGDGAKYAWRQRRDNAYKWIIKTDDGYKLYGSIPWGIADHVKEGDRVRLIATLVRSEKDPYFGFANHPYDARILNRDIEVEKDAENAEKETSKPAKSPEEIEANRRAIAPRMDEGWQIVQGVIVAREYCPDEWDGRDISSVYVWEIRTTCGEYVWGIIPKPVAYKVKVGDTVEFTANIKHMERNGCRAYASEAGLVEILGRAESV